MANSLIEDIKFSYHSGNNVTRFIILNVIVFVLLALLSLIDKIFRLGGMLSFYHLFTVPSAIASLLLKPWSLISYMFLHQDLWHLLSNLIMLYFGGRIFIEFLGNQRFAAVYVMGGISGALLYLILYNTLPIFTEVAYTSNLLGASAAVLAVFFTIASYLPNYEVHLILIGPVKLKYIALFIFLLDLLSIDKGNPGGHIAHIGGALYGLAYAAALRKGNDWSVPYLRLSNKVGSLFKAQSAKKMSKSYVDYKRSPKTKVSNPNSNKQEIIDQILDKISKSGYDSLTKEEKETIFKISKGD